MNRSTPGFPVHHQHPEFTRTHIHQVGDAIQPSHPLSSPSPAPMPPSIRVFSNESTLPMRWPKYWSFSFSIIPSQRTPRADLLSNGLVGSPCSPTGSQESSPTPQFKSINSSVLNSSIVAQLIKNLPAIQETLVSFLGQEDPPGEGIGYPLKYSWASLVAQLVKNLPAM